MKTSEKKLKKLKDSARSKLAELGPSHIRKGKFSQTLVLFDGYLDLFDTVDALINLCVLASQAEPYSPSDAEQPGEDIRKTLELLVTQLLPYDEGDFLDGVNQLLQKEVI